MEKKKIEEIISKLKRIDDRPIQQIRIVGNRRVEVYFLGDIEPGIYDLSEPTNQAADKSDHIDVKLLSDLKVAELKKVAKEYGLNPSGLRKAELVEAIERKVLCGGQPTNA